MSKRHGSARTSAGFSLMELMIVVVIIGILAAISIPAYSDYVKRGRITDAVGKLSDMGVRMEQFFQDNRTYIGACAPNTVAPKPVDTNFFAFTCPTLSASGYQIVATGANQMAGFDYTLTQDGAKTSTVPSSWGSGSTTCWIVSKDGSC